MTGTTPPGPAAARVILAAAADRIEARNYHTFGGGPQIWGAVHEAGQDLVISPAVEALRRHLRVDQVQFWDGTQAETVAVLRAAAGAAPLDLAAYQDADVTRRIEGTRAVLCQALNLHTGNGDSMWHLANLVTDRFRRDALENAGLTAENERLRAALRCRDDT